MSFWKIFLFLKKLKENSSKEEKVPNNKNLNKNNKINNNKNKKKIKIT